MMEQPYGHKTFKLEVCSRTPKLSNQNTVYTKQSILIRQFYMY